jgi:hypothetical protein
VKQNSEQKRKWATNFFGVETRTARKLSRNTEIVISYRRRNNIKHLLRAKESNNGKYNLSGVYQLQCADCPQKDVGQTGRTFRTIFKEHIRDIRNNGQSSKFAQHILNIGHGYDLTYRKERPNARHLREISHIRN